MDHLIHLLAREFLPEIEHRHKRQTLGMEGLNLAEKRRDQILTRAPETPLAKIKKIDDLHFEVQSSNSTKSYHINLDTKICNCHDFPKTSLFKHIAAIVHFFGGEDLGPQPPDDESGSNGSTTSESAEDKSPGQPIGHCADDDAAASILMQANNIIRLSNLLITEAPRDPTLAKSLAVIESQLSALVLSATAPDNGSRLPEKENIAPNQHTWPETATRMGENHGKKHCHGKELTVGLTAQHIGDIGEPNRKQSANDDLYVACSCRCQYSGACQGPKAEPPSIPVTPRPRPTLPPPTLLQATLPSVAPPMRLIPPVHIQSL